MQLKVEPNIIIKTTDNSLDLIKLKEIYSLTIDESMLLNTRYMLGKKQQIISRYCTSSFDWSYLVVFYAKKSTN